MINVVSRRCEVPDCVRQPNHGWAGSKSTRCGDHKLEGMVGVASRRCEFEGCTKQPNFGLRGGKAVRCKAHMTEDMVEVMARRCNWGECGKRALYGEGKAPTRCKDHKEEGMMHSANRRYETWLAKSGGGSSEVEPAMAATFADADGYGDDDADYVE